MESKFDDNFFSKRKHIAWRAPIICDQIIKHFNPKSVIDVGCSIGEFVKELRYRNILAVGTENTKAVYPHLLIPQDLVIINDITDRPLILDNRYDLAMCFMVINNLPEEKWNCIAKNLTVLSDTVITVVEDEEQWSSYMSQQDYYEDYTAERLFRQDLESYFDKTAIRSFRKTQVFRKREDEE